MPELEKFEHEVFCSAIAGGMETEEAYEWAGFTPGNRHAQRLLKRPEIIARIAEINAEEEARENEQMQERQRARDEAWERLVNLRRRLAGASRSAVVERLLEMAAQANLQDAAGIREARQTLIEAFKLARDVHETNGRF